jgi:HK97 family phage major capsid protein
MPDGVTLASGAALATKELKDKVENLSKNLNRILGEDGLEDDVKTAKDAAHDAKSKIEKLSEENSELVDDIKSLKEDVGEVQEHVDEVDTKVQEKWTGGRKPVENLGQKVLDEVNERNFKNRPTAGSSIKVNFDDVGLKDITNVSGSAGPVVFPDEREDIVPSPVLRQPRVIDLLTVLETSSDAVEWVKQKTETDNADVQSGQGSALGQTDMTFELNTSTVATLGHIAKSSIQILDDAPRLRTFVNTRMRQLLELALEDQVLLGDGTGNNLHGLIPQATSYNNNLESAVVDGTADDIDRIGVSILQVQRSNFPATGILLSPLNWWGIVLEKDDDGSYRFANAQSQQTPRLWGLPIVSTNAMPEGSSLVGNFSVGSTFYDRRQTRLEIATENSDDFEKLMVTIRAYLRGTVAVEQPDAMVKNENMDATAPASGS